MNSESKKERFKRYKETIISIINEVLPNCTVYLFGSRARGTNDEGADVDIALDAGAPIDRSKIGLMHEKLEESTMPLMVDLVDLHSASEKLKEEVRNEGILWKD